MPYRKPGSSQRRAWLVSASHALYCARGHRIPEDRITPGILEHGGVRCTARMNFGPADRPTECGAFLWILQMPGGWRFIAEVTIAELKEAGDRHLSIEQMFDFLDLEGEMLSLGTARAVRQTLDAERERDGRGKSA